MSIKYFIILFSVVVISEAQISAINKRCDFWKTVNFKNALDTVSAWGKHIAWHVSMDAVTNKAPNAGTQPVLYTIDPLTSTKDVLYRCILFGDCTETKRKIPLFLLKPFSRMSKLNKIVNQL